MVNKSLSGPAAKAAAGATSRKSDKFQSGRAVNWIVAAGNDCRLTQETAKGTFR
jgi:hypothetical protein